jgi:site-specific DNA-methyltransferase (adenine-specific)
MIVWDKGGLGMGWHYRRNYETVLVAEKPGRACKWYGGHDTPNVIRIPGIKPGPEDHPTPKPIELVKWFMRLHTQPGDVVLDPFMGGGTTLVAAKEMGRRAIGVELEERWCELAVKRLAQGILFSPPDATSTAEPRSMNLPGIETAESAKERGLSG